VVAYFSFRHFSAPKKKRAFRVCLPHGRFSLYIFAFLSILIHSLLFICYHLKKRGENYSGISSSTVSPSSAVWRRRRFSSGILSQILECIEKTFAMLYLCLSLMGASSITRSTGLVATSLLFIYNFARSLRYAERSLKKINFSFIFRTQLERKRGVVLCISLVYLSNF